MRSRSVVPVAVVAALVVAEVGIVGWWLTAGSLVVAVLLQFALASIVALVVVVERYRRFRRAFEEGIAAAAVAAERTRLAEELHDALGHELSVIALRAGALQVGSTGETRERAAALRADVEHAVGVLRESLEVLSVAAAGPAYAPATETTAALLERTRSSGAALTVTGELPPGLPALVERTVYGAVREALTNATKHAPGTPITVTLSADAAEVRLTVTNPMSAATAAPAAGPSTPATPVPAQHAVAQDVVGRDVVAGPGTSGAHAVGRDVVARDVVAGPGASGAHAAARDATRGPVVGDPGSGAGGLIAVRRRVSLLGGSLDAGTRGGEFVVDMALPRDPRPAAVPAVSAGLARPWRATLRATALPAVVAVAVLLGFYSWATAGATLEDDVFTRISPGMPRGQAEALLPDHQSRISLTAFDDHPPAWTCRHYTDGNFPLGMSTFQVCFAGGTVARTASTREVTP